MHRFIIFRRINQDDDEIDYKCYVKNLLRFFNNIIATKRIDKRFQESFLLFWIIENCDYLKTKRNNER